MSSDCPSFQLRVLLSPEFGVVCVEREGKDVNSIIDKSHLLKEAKVSQLWTALHRRLLIG